MRFLTFGDNRRTFTLPVKAVRQVIWQEYTVTKQHLEQCGIQGDSRTQWRIDVIHDYGKESFIFTDEAEASQVWVGIHDQIKVRK